MAASERDPLAWATRCPKCGTKLVGEREESRPTGGTWTIVTCHNGHEWIATEVWRDRSVTHYRLPSDEPRRTSDDEEN